MKVYFFYNLQVYIKNNSKTSVKSSNNYIIYKIIKNFYIKKRYTNVQSYCFSGDEFIKFYFFKISHSLFFKNCFYNKWFFLKINNKWI